jgi:hypothetical protein
VYKKTAIDDDGSESEAKIGAAEMLSPGEYVVEAKVRMKGKEVQLGSLAFTVK